MGGLISKEEARIEKEALQIPEDVTVEILKKARIEKEAVRIPEDVTVEILKRLPVKSLLRFRCAGKTWYSLISDPEFCNKLHQKRACVLILQKSVNETCTKYSTVTIESFMNEKTSIQSAPAISFPWRQPDIWLSKFVGSSNGLVCFKYESLDLSPSVSGLILWNPSTRKYRKLPSASRVRDRLDQYICAGFGYNESIDDYKFVWMNFKDPESDPSIIEFDVFSLKSNTWSSFDHRQSSDIMTSFYQTGVLINGAVHWVTSYVDLSSNGFRILSFNLSSDKFILLEPPQERSIMSHNSFVVSLSGCLCLGVYQGSHIDFWMMKEYGVNSSWLKLVTIPGKPSTLLRTFNIRNCYPIFFSKEEGKIVATIEYVTLEHYRVRDIMMFQVEEGAVVKDETLLSDCNYYSDYALMHETLVSLD